MLVAIITEQSTEKLIAVAQSVSLEADVIECRLDFLTDLKMEQLKTIHEYIQKPLIFTLRSSTQGGCFQGTETARLATLKTLAALEPAYMDLESSVPDIFITELHNAHPNIKIIRSYHNMTETPKNLDIVLADMGHPYVAVYKIVTTAQNTLDNFRVAHFVKKYAKNKNITAHCMGKLGLPSRLLGQILGNYFQYAMIKGSESPAPDCPDLRTLIDLYRIKQCNQDTKVFALLGDPIDHSIGHLFHNQQFAERKINAMYLKISLKPKELVEFFTLIRGLPFSGFSVTTPLKESMTAHMNHLERNTQVIGAVNTVHISNDRYYAINTDGCGALNAIEQSKLVYGSHVLIIGAGGAAKAIAAECALRKPALLAIVNRTLSRAQEIAEKTKGHAYDFEGLKTAHNQHYDIVINTLPLTPETDTLVLNCIQPYLSKNLVVLNIDYTTDKSLLLKHLKTVGCELVSPKAMFQSQAMQQFNYWLSRAT